MTNGEAKAPINAAASQAYNALSHAADQMGRNNYKNQMAAHLKAGREKSTFRFYVTPEHQLVVDAMPKVMAGKISPEEALALVLSYDVMSQRFD